MSLHHYALTARYKDTNQQSLPLPEASHLNTTAANVHNSLQPRLTSLLLELLFLEIPCIHYHIKIK